MNDRAALLRAYNRRGLANVELGQYAEAIRDFSAVIRLNPDVAGYYDNRQNALRQLGRLPEALRDADAAVRLAPGYTFVLRGRALVYDAMGRFDLALADFTRAINLDSKDAGLRADRAKIFAKISRLDDAYSDLTTAISLDPSNAGLLKDRGLLLARYGEPAAARSDLLAYLVRQPGDAEATQALAALGPTPTPPAASSANQDSDTLDAKKKLVTEAVEAHENCLAAALVDITPYSAESAPTIVDVALDRCSKLAERRIAIGVAAFDMTREQASEIVNRKVAEMRNKMISAVVTARAELAKKQNGGPEAPRSGDGLPKGQPL
ncbi:tetratricopeptide repeat protein [Methylobacterium phyllosphaerae]|uniref:tetratricopeptide repeat protein n=1 Tax=Methylobacterium phyllosphaerae TaxID=418223 RepID=UPI00131DD17C|nr:tetratricopeptide repeat protein [Methylobacterium phyllosphaerae]